MHRVQRGSDCRPKIRGKLPRTTGRRPVLPGIALKNVDGESSSALDDTMKRFTKAELLLTACIALIASALVAPARGAETKSSDEQTLRDLDAKWSAAAGAKDVDKVVSYYSENAMVMPANAPIASTHDAIRKVWLDLFTNAGAAVSWKATKVEVATSGDMAYLTGTYQLTVNDPSGKPTTDHGKYAVVWQKKAGVWKAVVDIWNSDLPAAVAAAAEKKD